MSFPTHFKRPAHAGLTFDKPSLVQPHFQRDCDINRMIQRALGGDASVFARKGVIVDAGDAPESYHEAMNIMVNAQQVWDELPDNVRRAYGNAAHFVAAIEEERSKMVKPKSADTVSEPPAPAVDKSVTPSGAEASTPKSAPTT